MDHMANSRSCHIEYKVNLPIFFMLDTSKEEIARCERNEKNRLHVQLQVEQNSIGKTN